jgi:hypothetical protein
MRYLMGFVFALALVAPPRSVSAQEGLPPQLILRAS